MISQTSTSFTYVQTNIYLSQPRNKVSDRSKVVDELFKFRVKNFAASNQPMVMGDYGLTDKPTVPPGSACHVTCDGLQ